MFPAKVKSLALILVLLLSTSLFTAGCGQKDKQAGWVNTDSMPGKTFTSGNSKRQSSSTIVYLGSDGPSSDRNFGPRDVSFEFRDLK